MSDPVAVTGIGVVSAVGTDADVFWKGLCEGASAAAPIRSFDATDLPVPFACEVGELAEVSEHAGLSRVEQFSQFAVVAAAAAAADARLGEVDAARAGVYAGCGLGGIAPLETAAAEGILGGDENRIRPTLLPRVMPNAPAAEVAMRLGWRGPNLAVSTVCAAGGHAIGEAARLLSHGAADVMIAGGSEAPITPFVIRGFNSLTALSRRGDDPASAARPFAADRDGFVLGEGAAFLVLERMADAVARGARVYALVVGYASNIDAHSLVMPSPNGEGAAACITAALVDARVSPGDVAHVNAHGTGTPQNDLAEAQAVTGCFGDGGEVSVTSTKATTGHLMGAAGAIEAAASALTIHHGQIPPTANTVECDLGLDLDLVTGQSRALRPGGLVVSNSFGFGGHNACLVMAPT